MYHGTGSDCAHLKISVINSDFSFFQVSIRAFYACIGLYAQSNKRIKCDGAYF